MPSPGRVEALARGIAGLDSRSELLDRMKLHPQMGANLVETSDEPTLLALPLSSLKVSSHSSKNTTLARPANPALSETVDILNQPVLVNSPIPEPTSVMLVLTGLVGLFLRRQLRRKMA